MSMSVWESKKKEEQKNYNTHTHNNTHTHPPYSCQPQPALKPTCDLCGNSTRIWLSGHDLSGNQIYCCPNSIHGRHRFKIEHTVLKRNPDNVLDNHVRRILEQAKNMDTSTIAKTDCDVGKTDSLVSFAWIQKKKGKKDNTIKIRVYYLEWLLKKGANLANPNSVETILCTEPMTNAQKYLAINAYKAYCKIFKILWDDPPKSNYQAKEPFCPTSEEINALIFAAGRRTATFLQLLATTGMRTGEATRLKWIDIDSKASTIAVNSPEKGSNTRTIPVPEKTILMLSALPRKYGDSIFSPNNASARSNLVYLRKKLASIQKNNRFNQIHLHTFRHYFAKKKLLETNNKPYVQYLLGHKSTASTDRYTSFKNYPIEGKYVSTICLTADDAKRCSDEGQSFVCIIDGHPMFRRSA
jgi:integrase